MRAAQTLLVLAVLSLTACASNSSILKLPDGAYQVSGNASPGRRGPEIGIRSYGPAHKRMSVNIGLRSADKHCHSLGRETEVVKIEVSNAWRASGATMITFNCK